MKIGALSMSTATVRHDLQGLTDFRDALVETAGRVGLRAASWHLPD
jgi:hypothetical protein